MSLLYHEFFPELGCVTDVVPSELIQTLWANVKRAEEESVEHNSYLAGQLEKQLQITGANDIPGLRDYLSPLASFYSEKVGSEPGKFFIDTLWVNFQRKHEFQPSHTHSGDYSFVVWLKIPYILSEEAQTPFSSKSSEALAGCFEFCYPVPGTMRTVTTIVQADKSYENRILLFPSHLQHAVYPFSTSEDVRVSISGNLIKTQP